jgi:hypothetical protein
LGLKITNVVSTAVLSAAKESLGDSILCDRPRDFEFQHKPVSENNEKSPLLLNETSALTETTENSEPFVSKDLPQTPQTPDRLAKR